MFRLFWQAGHGSYPWPLASLFFVLPIRFLHAILGAGGMPMRSMLFAAGCLLLAGTAEAQVIYRCKGADGVASIQSEPCAAAQGDLGARYYAPVEDSPEALERRRQADAEMERRRRQQAAPVYGSGRTARTTDARTQQRARCESARRHRDDTLERLGTRRTFDIVRSLNESVQRACKGL